MVSFSLKIFIFFFAIIRLSLSINSIEFASKFISSAIKYDEIDKFMNNKNTNIFNLFLIYSY